jgi:predicted dehydrogenase
MQMLLRALFLVLLMTDLTPAADNAQLIIVDPGHFHAALIQKDMIPFLSPRVSVYGALSPELLDYLNRIALFNSRPDQPTHWELEVHTGPGFFDRMLREHAGNAVVFTGRNRGKIDRILASLESGYHVFADKPWIVTSADLPKLATALDLSEKKGLAAYDIMTERFEITSILQRELVNSPDITGAVQAVKARSVHHIMKMVAGVPIKRPVWFFDINEYGEALADVGTHVVDLVQWTLFPTRKLDYRTDVHVLDARHWPTPVTRAQFKQVTGESDFPASLSAWVRAGRLEYLSNNSVRYTVARVPVELDILWNWEAPEGAGDVYEASFSGARSRVEIRQAAVPELYVIPEPAAAAAVFAALERKIADLRTTYPGIAVDRRGPEARIVIPPALRVGHEAHFSQVARQFFDYMREPAALPAWEKANMMVKYAITTKGVESAR